VVAQGELLKEAQRQVAKLQREVEASRKREHASRDAVARAFRVSADEWADSITSASDMEHDPEAIQRVCDMVRIARSVGLFFVLTCLLV